MAKQEGRRASGVRFFSSALAVAALLAVVTHVSAQSRAAEPTATAPSDVSTEPTSTPSETRTAAAEPTPAPVAPFPPVPPDPPAEPGRVLYFTFDDGPSPAWTPQILNLLEDYGATATFFQIGGEAARHAALVDLIRDGGHSIGNHTWSHPDLTRLSAKEVRSQVLRTEEVIGGTTCARPPMGATNTHVREVFATLGKTEHLWDIDTRDWENPGSTRIVETVLANARDGAVVLLHDGGGDRSQTVTALDEVLPRLTEAGWRIEGIPGC